MTNNDNKAPAAVKHTPTPWAAFSDGDHTNIVAFKLGTTCVFSLPGRHKSEPDILRMIECVNSHDALTAGVDALAARCERLEARVRVLEAALDECEEYLEDHEDVVDGPDGEPQPNRAMTLLREVRLLTGSALS